MLANAVAEVRNTLFCCDAIIYWQEGFVKSALMIPGFQQPDS